MFFVLTKGTTLLCFSKSEEIHDKVIGMYINRFYFKESVFLKCCNQ
ncbi:MAG: hypothetical protein CSB24_02780 [Deltaproteobacteria bacterium]|nr:MAG: hypothetical protein CSB24_02780 [Deltaproteobacteria bacterium]